MAGVLRFERQLSVSEKCFPSELPVAERYSCRAESKGGGIFSESCAPEGWAALGRKAGNGNTEVVPWGSASLSER